MTEPSKLDRKRLTPEEAQSARMRGMGGGR